MGCLLRTGGIASIFGESGCFNRNAVADLYGVSLPATADERVGRSHLDLEVLYRAFRL